MALKHPNLPKVDYTHLDIGDTVTIEGNPNHKQWKDLPPDTLNKMFPTTETITKLRPGPGNRTIATLTNGFEYVLDTGWQHNSVLSYIASAKN